MRTIIFFLCTFLIIRHAISQTPKKTTSKNEMQNMMSEMTNGLNKQIADLEKKIATAKKNKGDSEYIKQLEGQLVLLKKQSATIGGVSDHVANTSDEVLQQANEQLNTGNVPKKDIERINALPKKTLTDAELTVFLQKAYASIDKKMSLSQKK